MSVKLRLDLNPIQFNHRQACQGRVSFFTLRWFHLPHLQIKVRTPSVHTM